ncbi:hypothetical protein ACJX0J_008952, partial [Zea mays]
RARRGRRWRSPLSSCGGSGRAFRRCPTCRPTPPRRAPPTQTACSARATTACAQPETWAIRATANEVTTAIRISSMDAKIPMNVSGHKSTGALASVSTQLEVSNASALEEPMATTPSEMAAPRPQLQ